MENQLTRKRLKLVILLLLTTVLFLVKQVYDLQISYENILSEKDDELMKIREEVKELKKAVTEEKIIQGYNWKWIGGISGVIFAIALFTYLGGVDPNQMANGLNSLGLENLDISNQNNQLNTKGNKEIIDFIAKCFERLEITLNDKFNSNQSWFETIIKILKNNTSNADFFGDNRPPKFR